MSSVRYCCIFLAFCLLSQTAVSLPLAEYPHATTVFESREQAEDYRLTLGELKKANSQWRAEREQRLGGELYRRTFELDAGITATEVFEYYRQQLVQLKGRELFHCQSRRCGSSNSWANTRFRIKQLYGLDQSQLYSAYEVIAEGQQRAYVALYGVRRGNKRSYVQLDVLTTDQYVAISSSPDVIVQRLSEGQVFSLPGIRDEEQLLESVHLESLKSVLSQRRHWTIALVGHNFSKLPLSQQREKSLTLAQGVREQLLALGVKPGRVHAFGVGGLMPVDESAEFRLDAVLLPRGLQ